MKRSLFGWALFYAIFANVKIYVQKSQLDKNYMKYFWNK